jgi:hypothetical protein
VTEWEAKGHLDHLQRVADETRLTAFGFTLTSPGSLFQLKAGKIELEPPPSEELPSDTDFRLQYVSWDGQRRRDVTDMTDAEVVAFLRTEPDGMWDIPGPKG